MEFERKITRLPRPYDAERGREARAFFPALSGDAARLVEGAGGCSPYLLSLMGKEAVWMTGAMNAPQGALDGEFARLRETGAADMPTALRQAKRRVALLTGLADLGGVWSLEEVTGALTDFADLAVQLACRATLGREIARGKLPGATEDDLESLGGMFVLAMGKMGAHELNYSSDIDLICLFDESRYDRDDYHEARASFVRATRGMAAMLSEMTGEGYVFRTDLRLRPDPAVTPVCMAAEAAERYYEGLGRTWERAAYIKARVCAGDEAAGGRFLDTLTPFVWRKHLDFAAIQDAHDMRLRIREHKGLGGRVTLEGHNMKLGRGGIREIEFFTQTRQIIAGGRDTELRDRRTVPALMRLAESGWVPEDTADALAEHYRAHREVEHRVQMIGDAQTHLLPKNPEGMEQLAAFMGKERAALEADLRERIEDVHARIEGFFAPDGERSAEETVPELDEDIINRWRTYPALRSERGQQIFGRLKPEILSKLAKSADPHQALLAFDGFLAGLPAGVQLFSLFEANPQLVDLLVDISGTVAPLAKHLARNASVFDAVIGGDFFSEWPGTAALSVELREALAREDDYERKLDLARRWGKEWHFRIGVHFLRGLIGAEDAGVQYAELAQAMLTALWPEVVAQFSEKHGAPPGRGAAVLGMGSLGAGRLTSRSDLDIIVIYDPEDEDMSDGRRPLAARPYYARLTQALVTAMTAPMAEGKLYELDMRLRPSGNQGPVATSWRAFRTYQQEEAWLWEHLALTRARPVAGEPELCEDFMEFRQPLLKQKGQDHAAALQGVAEMRARIARAKAPSGAWDAKIGPGRMQDIELVSQVGALAAAKAPLDVASGLAGLHEAGIADEGQVQCLSESHGLLWRLNLVTRFLSEREFEPEAAGEGARALVLKVMEAESMDALLARITGAVRAAADVIDDILGEVEDEG
ncbi:glutamine-synthetase adenylyltransferase [Rhodobacteraceae bacterium 63075]|nr:glutamine-synthetase adenylyltransferase [Rhodobacteraceae bacterium 63075]